MFRTPAHLRRDLYREQQVNQQKQRSLTWDADKGQLDACPHCGSSRLTACEGRFLCNACQTHVSGTAGTLAHKSHLSKDKRQKLYECYKNGISQRKACEIAGVNKNTASSWYSKFEYAGYQEECIEASNTYQTNNPYSSSNNTDEEATQNLISRGSIPETSYVDKEGYIRDNMNNRVSHISGDW